MRPALVITHLRDPHLGLVGEALADAGIPVVHMNLFSDRTLPALGDVSGIASLGGQMSVIELARFPFLVAELELVGQALESEVPIIGLCLGAQMLALAAHGDVTRMDRRYIGWPELSPAVEARDDPLFHDLPADLRVIKWHADAISPPPSAAVLASTKSPGCALFRTGTCAWGSQMHLESTWEMLFEAWLVDPIERRALLEGKHDPERFAAQCDVLLPRQISAMRVVFRRFAEQVARSQLST